MARIRLQEISFTYEGAREPTLLPISLDINDGEAFSLLGASGAGRYVLQGKGMLASQGMEVIAFTDSALPRHARASPPYVPDLGQREWRRMCV